jgi:release factor glutamine methyltransferase
LLVDLALQRLPPNGRVLDMGTGSGAIAVALAYTRPDAIVSALDVSAAALAIALRNTITHGVTINFLRSDWYGALGDQRFEVIVANPPYIVSGDAHLSQGDLRFEPLAALTDHADGLSALRSIIAGAAAHLESGGWLLMEHGYDQAASVRDLLAAQGFGEVQSWQDLAGIERASGGIKPPHGAMQTPSTQPLIQFRGKDKSGRLIRSLGDNGDAHSVIE